MKKLKTTLTILLCFVAALGCLISCIYTATLAARIDQVARASRADMNYLRSLIRNLEGELTEAVIDRLDAIARPSDGMTNPPSSGTDGLPVGGDAESDTWVETRVDTTAETADDSSPAPAESAVESENTPETDAQPETYPETLPASRPETLPAEETSFTPETIPEWEILPPASDSETSAPDEPFESERESDTTPETDTVDIPTHNRPETESPVEDTASPAALYTIAAYKGHIGVFDATGRVVREVNVFLFALPAVDREALAVGIPAYSREEMVAIVARYE